MEDISIRSVGRKPTLEFDWQAQLVLPPGQRCPRKSERDHHSLFHALHCTHDPPHLRSLLPSSIQKKGHLICKLCHTDDQLTALKCGHPSSHERFVYDLLDSHPFFASGPQHWATEVAVFHKITGQRLCQKACRVDIVFFNGLSVSRGAMHSALLLFIDGEGHQAGLYTGTGTGCQSACKQATKDRKLSQDAAALGYKVARLSSADLDEALPFITAAWRKAQATSADIGWVLVSRRWDTGAHPVTSVEACRATCCLEVDSAAAGCADCADVADLCPDHLAQGLMRLHLE